MTTPSTPLSRRRFIQGSAIAAGAGAMAACTTASPPAPRGSGSLTPLAVPTPTPSPTDSPDSLDSWAPLPLELAGLRLIARQDGRRLLLHTVGGDVSFWSGVTLGTTTPGHLPGHASATRVDYRRWLPMMAKLGIRVIRLTTLHPSFFYTELRAYNIAHPTAPLYLLQGIDVPDNDLLAAKGLFDPALTERASNEVVAVAAALHGDLQRRAGSAGPTGVTGTWDADVSEWTVGVVFGSRWVPEQLERTDTGNRKAGAVTGRYVTSTADASPSERWLAARLDELATELARRGTSAPLAVGSTPELDPLAHPQQPEAPANAASIDPGHIRATAAWPAGGFAAVEAYPYKPLFLFHEPDLGTEDPYRAYLKLLSTSLGDLPLLITSFGVSSALGSGGKGTNDRGQGHHTEPDAMKQNADMLRMFASIGLAGGMLPGWHDDWSASTWNTSERYAKVPPARRVLFHDPLTSDQWTGLVAHDPLRVGKRVVHEASADYLRRITFDHDASWAYLTLYFQGRVTSPVELGFSILGGGGLRFPGGSGDPIFDVAVRMVPTMSTTVVFIRSALDPIRLDGLPRGWWPSPERGGWNTQQLVLNRTYLVPGATTPVPPSFLDIGTLILGSWWDETAADYNSLATWHMARASAQDPAILRFRLPWSMLALADPSARSALVPTTSGPTMTAIKSMNVTVESSTPGSPVTFPLSWPRWERASYTERVKSGADSISTALAEVSRRLPAETAGPSRSSGAGSPTQS
ncbi:MAG: twin-arginine translocation signal domain-containing protein [Micrococcales bacterium]|nr:twin-arginine translocation signal domain-containing protein [Micrococcales bacterium]